MKHCLLFAALFAGLFAYTQPKSWIRINNLGYTPQSKKIAVWCSKEGAMIGTFQLADSATGKVVFTAKASAPFGAYGPFAQTCRLDFSNYKRSGTYFLKAGAATSPYFKIDNDVYKGAADFVLRYMRQQRSGFNPFLKDSCHTQDGYVLYGEKAGIKDSSFTDVAGGWHDASDYLQYAATSANATYHLLMAQRDFKDVFRDEHGANGLPGKNETSDILDEARWGLDWLLKMHPEPGIMFNQIADDRDHRGMRIPAMDSLYGKGYQRPVYFVSGEPQQRGKFLNGTTGTSSTGGKFASAFALGAAVYNELDSAYASDLMDHAVSALDFAAKKPGVTQTASVQSPYIYAEDNWADDMELAYAGFSATMNGILKGASTSMEEGPNGNFAIDSAFLYAQKEKITPWLGADTAKHYQWYPFINIGHYELAKQLSGSRKDTIISYYKQGIQRILEKAKRNAFYRGIPFIWCSNNLTTSFAIQCYWYKQLTSDTSFESLEAANFDWLFGLNPWGTSMVYGLPLRGDTPTDPHSAFTHLKNYPVDGGLVDGPVSGSIYKNLIGIKLYEPDEYAPFQSDLAVYHDDYGDYSTNEPTMDGTASLIYLLAAKEAEARKADSKLGGRFSYSHGAITRGDSTKKELALVFTGDEFGDGGAFIRKTLKQHNVKAAFFLTGRFYRNPKFKSLVQGLKNDGHYLGAHSNDHLLYADWKKRNSLLVTKKAFNTDLLKNYAAMKAAGIQQQGATYFLPPYEWYNDTIAAWTQALGLQLINYTPGTLSHADYTTLADKGYRSSEIIFNSIANFEKKNATGLNGAIMLLHIGTDPKRTDKFYNYLPRLLRLLTESGYRVVPVNELLSSKVKINIP
jgi:peptidoglycan/xylan/chitin deacetylase (PgdA/CDA1 family)